MLMMFNLNLAISTKIASISFQGSLIRITSFSPSIDDLHHIYNGLELVIFIKKAPKSSSGRFCLIIYLGESRLRNITQILQDVELSLHIRVLSFLS